jgi:hypothetical protein
MRNWFVIMDVQEAAQGRPLEQLPSGDDTPAAEADYVGPLISSEATGMAVGGKLAKGQSFSPNQSTLEGAPSGTTTLRRRLDTQASLPLVTAKDQKAAAKEELTMSTSTELKTYGWQKGLHQIQLKRRGALLNTQAVVQLDKPAVLLRSLLSVKTAHWVDAAPILEVGLLGGEYWLAGSGNNAPYVLVSPPLNAWRPPRLNYQ